MASECLKWVPRPPGTSRCVASSTFSRVSAADTAMHINAAMFEQNRQSGYVLKPRVMWDREHPQYGHFNPWEKDFEMLQPITFTVNVRRSPLRASFYVDDSNPSTFLMKSIVVEQFLLRFRLALRVRFLSYHFLDNYFHSHFIVETTERNLKCKI